MTFYLGGGWELIKKGSGPRSTGDNYKEGKKLWLVGDFCLERDVCVPGDSRSEERIWQ